MDSAQPFSIRPYCRVEMRGLSWNRLGQRWADPIIAGLAIQAWTASRVVSVISNRTGPYVLL